MDAGSSLPNGQGTAESLGSTVSPLRGASAGRRPGRGQRERPAGVGFSVMIANVTVPLPMSLAITGRLRLLTARRLTHGDQRQLVPGISFAERVLALEWSPASAVVPGSRDFACSRPRRTARTGSLDRPVFEPVTPDSGAAWTSLGLRPLSACRRLLITLRTPSGGVTRPKTTPNMLTHSQADARGCIPASL
jgi:hypothetical protein